MQRFYPKKITTALIGLTTENLQKVAEQHAQKEPVTVCRVYGRIMHSDVKTGTYGTYTRYQGEFEAQNALNGTIHRSRVLLLPPVAETVIDEMLASGRENDPDATVEVALDINVEYYDNPNKTGTRFRFNASPLIEAAQDSIAKMGASFGTVKLIGTEENTKKVTHEKELKKEENSKKK